MIGKQLSINIIKGVAPLDGVDHTLNLNLAVKADIINRLVLNLSG